MVFSPNYLSFPSFDYSFLKNCSEVLLLLSLEERAFSCSSSCFSSLNTDMTFIISNRGMVLVLLDLFKLATPCGISYARSFTSLGGNYLIPHFWTFGFLRYVFIPAVTVSVWLPPLTSMKIEARIYVIWSYLLSLICTPASLCNSSSLQVISSCSQQIFCWLF